MHIAGENFYSLDTFGVATSSLTPGLSSLVLPRHVSELLDQSNNNNNKTLNVTTVRKLNKNLYACFIETYDKGLNVPCHISHVINMM